MAKKFEWCVGRFTALEYAEKIISRIRNGYVDHVKGVDVPDVRNFSIYEVYENPSPKKSEAWDFCYNVYRELAIGPYLQSITAWIDSYNTFTFTWKIYLVRKGEKYLVTVTRTYIAVAKVED